MLWLNRHLWRDRKRDTEQNFGITDHHHHHYYQLLFAAAAVATTKTTAATAAATVTTSADHTVAAADGDDQDSTGDYQCPPPTQTGLVSVCPRTEWTKAEAVANTRDEPPRPPPRQKNKKKNSLTSHPQTPSTDTPSYQSTYPRLPTPKQP